MKKEIPYGIMFLNRKQIWRCFLWDITQDLTFRKLVVEYSLKYGVTRASIQYKQNRKTIYRCREKHAVV